VDQGQQPSRPPKVGVTAKESGTYNDFTNINLGGLRRDGSDGVSELSYLILEVVDELRLLQPQTSVHISQKTPDRFLKAAARVIRNGYGYPSIFNTDAVVMEQMRVGKTVEDAREGGCSGCIETGAFGKEAYILTGYLNVPKVLELALNNGRDQLTGKQIGPKTGEPESFAAFDDLYAAFARQLDWVVDLKIRVNNYIERMYAAPLPPRPSCPWSSTTASKRASTTTAAPATTPTTSSAAASARSRTASPPSRPMSLTPGPSP
jgi:Pyruvate-formate lyase